MADFLQAIVLGIVQGITEWLPVSSKGNVTAIGQFMGIETNSAFAFAILLHIGTLIAAAIYFRKEIIRLIFLKDRELLKFIIITLVFTGVLAVPCYFLLKKILEQETMQIFGLTIYSQTIFMILLGIFLLVTGIIQKKAKKTHQEKNLSSKNAVFLGLGQGLTVLPGMSRSGTTTSIMLFEKFSPEEAFRISFLISVPAVLLGELSFNILEAPQIDGSVIIGIIVSAIVGYASIHALLKIAKKINFSKFCIALGIIYLAIAAATIAMPFLA